MYKAVYKPDHHRADVTGMVAEHVLIAEKELDRPLEKGEIVHHKDFDKLNNKLTNLLFPISRQEHQKLPEYQARFIIAKGLYTEFLAFWLLEKAHDEVTAEQRKLEKKLVQAENERARLSKKEHTI